MKRLAAALALLAFATGCPDKDKAPEDAGLVPEGPAQLEEKEPNDRPEQALRIQESAIVVASLTADPSKPDEDWFVLAPASPMQADVSLSGIGGADVVLAFFDRDRNPLVTVNSEGDGQGERFPNLSVGDSVLVRVNAAKKGVGGAYTLSVTFSPVDQGREIEPNDRAVDATPLPLGGQISGFVAHAGDQDWFRIELPAPPEPEPSPAPVPQTPESPSPGMTAPEPEVPEAAVAQVDGGEAAKAPGAGGPLAEIGRAVAPPPPPEIVQPAGEEEMGGALRIEVSAVEGVRLEVALLTEAEAPLFEVKGNVGEAVSLRNVGVRKNDRVVFLVVKSAWMGTGKEARRGYDAEVPYTVAVSQEPAGANAEYEPNDDMARATPLPRDGFREGFLVPKTDVDYYVLRMNQPVLAQFQVSGVDRLDLALEVVRKKEDGGEETLLRANDGEVKEPEVLNNVHCPGECFVKVMGGVRKIDGRWVRDFENAEQPYRLSVSVVPDLGQEEREPNGTVEAATPISLGRPIRGTIQPRKDVDYYRLDLSDRPVRTSLRATLLGILKVDLGLYLHRVEEDGSLSLVQTADRAKGEQPETIRYSAEPGVYVFEVRDSTRRSEANFQDRYQLTVQEGD